MIASGVHPRRFFQAFPLTSCDLETVLSGKQERTCTWLACSWMKRANSEVLISFILRDSQVELNGTGIEDGFEGVEASLIACSFDASTPNTLGGDSTTLYNKADESV